MVAAQEAALSLLGQLIGSRLLAASVLQHNKVMQHLFVACCMVPHISHLAANGVVFCVFADLRSPCCSHSGCDARGQRVCAFCVCAICI